MTNIIDEIAKTIWLAEFSRAFNRTPSDPWENQAEPIKEGHRKTAQKLMEAGYITPAASLPSTPAAKWRAEGKPDPHGDYYDCERAKLAHGDMTDDEIANAVFLSSDIGILTAAKERIRWLSRALAERSFDSTTEPQVAPDRQAMAALIRDYLQKKYGTYAVQMASDGMERIYYNGVSLLDLADALVVSRPNHCPQDTTP